MRVYAPDLKHRAHPPWTHQIQQLHHPVPSISRSPIPFWHPHLQFDDPAFLGRMFCIKFLLRSTDTEIQSYPSVTRDFQSITSCLCNRWSSSICFDELPCSELPPSILPLQYPRPYECTMELGCDCFFVGDMIRHGRDVSVTGEKKIKKKSRGRVTSLSDHACIIVTVSRVLFFIILPPKRFISFDQYKMTKTEKLGSF